MKNFLQHTGADLWYNLQRWGARAAWRKDCVMAEEALTPMEFLDWQEQVQ